MEGLIAVSLARRFGFFRAREPGAELRPGRSYSGVQPNHPPLSCARPPVRLGRTAALRRVISRPAALEEIHRRQDFLGVDDRHVLPHEGLARFASGDCRCEVPIARGSILRDTWLNIPQAVVLESTGNLQLARDLDDDDPDRLVIKAILRLPPLISLDIDAFPNIEAARQQWRALVGSQVEESAYEKGLRRVHAKLLEGVTTKGSRAPNRPLQVIDPA